MLTYIHMRAHVFIYLFIITFIKKTFNMLNNKL